VGHRRADYALKGILLKDGRRVSCWSMDFLVTILLHCARIVLRGVACASACVACCLLHQLNDLSDKIARSAGQTFGRRLPPSQSAVVSE
jgi:hypothetical protein